MRKVNGSSVNIVVKGIGAAQPRTKKRARPGNKIGQSPGSVAHRFKPGNQFGTKANRHIPKFSDAYELKLLEPMPEKLRRQLRLPTGATLMDAIINAVVQKAIGGDLSSVVEIREVTQGRVENRNLNITASMSQFLSDPGFRDFLEQQHGAYLTKIGVLNDGRRNGIPTEASLSKLSDTEGEDYGEEN
jgi:hypothetical protein